VPFNGQVQYSAGVETAKVFELAVAHFDSAMAYQVDSMPIVTMIRVGKGRALLDLGRYTEAADAVAPVQTADAYLLQYVSSPLGSANGVFSTLSSLHVTDREGGNGLPWLTQQDPRVKTDAADKPTKYSSGSASTVLASGIEARLIEAEAAYQAHDSTTFMDKLNELRQTVPLQTDAEYPPLGDLTDPGSDTARVTMLFTERAYWLYLTGHRNGDLRRMIRQYGRDQATLYPSGPYTPSNRLVALYGTNFVVPIPDAERNNNPRYNGCFNLNA
jgi:hypothetical protein